MKIIKNNKTSAGILANGALAFLKTGETMINQVNGNLLDGSLMNIYLRVFSQNNQSEFTPLLGPKSPSNLQMDGRSACWSGTFENINYEVCLQLSATESWYWTIKLDAAQNCQADLTYVQDLGLGLPSFVQANEAYASQYIDHLVLQNDGQITVCSRQNQTQAGKNPFLQQGAFSKLRSYATDGFQFYGLAYKQNDVLQAMLQTDLANRKYQYEFALTALRTEKLTITPQGKEQIFYAAFAADQPNDNQTALFSTAELKKDYQLLQEEFSINKLEKINLQPSKPLKTLAGQPLTSSELEQLFPKKRRLQSEYQSDQLLSFFDLQQRHIVLPAKEILQERMTGNVVMSYDKITVGQPLMATTQYMCGIFASQTVFGNTNLNILSTNTRNALNVFKAPGTRIWLKINGTWQILTMPSLFCMSFEGADWYYKIADDLLKISVEALADGKGLILEVSSAKNQAYDFRIATQLSTTTLGEGLSVKIKGKAVKVAPAADTLVKKRCVDLAYWFDLATSDGKKLKIKHQVTAATEQYLIFDYQNCTQLKVSVGTSLVKAADYDLKVQRKINEKKINDLIGDFSIDQTKLPNPEYAQQTKLIVPWFTHDALVHLLSPHGLEQYGGAAWGTRDVSQGPTELLLSLQQFKQVEQIIFQVYQHQFIENGSWPQWFMFDEYADQFAAESHGDIVVWPLKVVADYLKKTGNEKILDSCLPFFSLQKKQLLTSKVPLTDHLERQLDYLQENFLFDTSVSSYGDGDWDDTLQPADPQQKKTMASTWTMELTIEALNTLTEVLQDHQQLKQRAAMMVTAMKRDFKKYFMQDPVLPGFIQMNQKHEIKFMIHPSDRTTGIKYRLLPLQQGILSGVFNDQQAEAALKLIHDKLSFPDGTRLMDQPAPYSGGVSHTFKRAEQSACFGREIGLMYTHAHIRYAEALVKRNKFAQAWDALMKVNPINLQKRIANADYRQANTYFSSSDGEFADRYQAEADFGKLRTGTVKVKGGWRLYSSGPGIYVAVIRRLINKNV